MKKLIVSVLVLLMLAGAAFAQSTSSSTDSDSEYYVRSVSLIKVFSGRLGFKCVYTTPKLEVAEVWLPMRWFGSSATGPTGEIAKGVIVYGDDPSYPFLSVFYKKGKFAFVKLFVHRSMNHTTWGTLPEGDFSTQFNVEEVKLGF